MTQPPNLDGTPQPSAVVPTTTWGVLRELKEERRENQKDYVVVLHIAFRADDEDAAGNFAKKVEHFAERRGGEVVTNEVHEDQGAPR